ncbi:MAG: UvrD-helicase domain-containing protein [Bacillota bacterium]
MLKIYKGPTGSGKTSILEEKYRENALKVGTEENIVFLKSASSVNNWRNNIDLKYLGPLNIFTYFGFIQKEIRDKWIYIEKNLEGLRKKVEPTFMNVETAHFVMSKFVEKKRKNNEIFDYINATSSQIAVQLIDNLNYGAMNCLNFEEMEKRLLDWANKEEQKHKIFKESINIMKIFREFCIKNRVIDYSLLVDLYNKILLPNENYLNKLRNEFFYLYVDDLEKTVPAAQKLYEILNNNTKKTYMTFNPEAGINRFFGGNPVLAKKQFLNKGQIIEFSKSFTSSEESRELANGFKERVLGNKNSLKTKYIKGEIDTELRGDMFIKTAKKVVELIKSGIKPGEIALIAPNIDKVMEFTLEHYFENKGYNVYNFKNSKRLVDIPFAQALITLTLLTNPDWNINIDYSSLHQTISLLLDLDPVRSGLITEEIFKNAYVLPEINNLALRERVGFNSAEKYDHLRNWVEEKKNREIEVAHFFQLVFGELLAPLSPSDEDILACRQIIESVKKFKNVVESFKDFNQKELGKDFIEMIYNGTIAAEVLYQNEHTDDEIILATPYKFLQNPQIDSVKYIFLLDISSNNWLRSIAKELSNPYIFSPQWKNERNWDDELDQNLRKIQLVEFFQSIISKSQEGLYLNDSYLNSQGWEQEGKLYDWLQLNNEVIVND